jgi:hypothetical protein
MDAMEEMAAEERLDATAFVRVRTSIVRDAVVLSAVRVRTNQQALDFVTIAMPTASPGPRADAASSRDATAIVELANGPGIVHSAECAPSTSPLPASVQLVLRVPPSERGAIVTVLSSEAGCEEMLAREAEAIAGSLRIESADE